MPCQILLPPFIAASHHDGCDVLAWLPPSPHPAWQIGRIDVVGRESRSKGEQLTLRTQMLEEQIKYSTQVRGGPGEHETQHIGTGWARL